MAGLLGDHVGITNNIIKARYGIPEYTLYRKAWGMNRTGADIGRNGNKAAEKFDATRRTKSVTLFPAGGWSITPLGGDAVTLNTDEFKDAQIPKSQFDDAGAESSGGSIISMPVHSYDDSVPGSEVPANVAGNSILGMRRQYSATALWDVSKMIADEGSFPPIDYPDEFTMIKMDRLIRSKNTYPENMGFMFGWGGGQGNLPSGPILNFYFGGNTDVTGTGEAGGEYGLQILGRGDARLFERNPFNKDLGRNQWEYRTSFNWGSVGQFTLGLTQLMAIPYGRDHFAFLSPVINSPNLIMGSPGVSSVSTSAIGPGASRVNAAFIESAAATGHAHTKSVTGSGLIRMDSARNSRKAWQFSRIIYPTTGRLVDDNFTVKGPVVGGTIIRITMDTFIMQDGGTVTATLYNAKTHAPCASPTLNQFALDDGQNDYYFVFNFTRSTDGYRSPILWGFIVMIVPLIIFNDDTFSDGGRIRSVNIAGQSSDPTTESAGLEVFDPANQLMRLQNHDGFRCDIVERSVTTGAIVCRLFEGDMAAPENNFRGKSNIAYKQWRNYNNLKMIGIASRLGEQVPLHMVSFMQDYDAPYDDNGQQIQRTWTVPQVMRFLLNDCGVPDDEIDIPSFYDVVRLWQSPKLKPDDYTIFPGGDQTYLRLLQKLCKDYLGAYLIRDPNAGPRGMWRIMPAKTSPYSQTLAQFYQYRPVYMNGRRSTQDAWGDGSSFIRDKSYREEIRRPEINYINVVGVFDLGEDSSPKSKCEAELYNLDSHDFLYPTVTASRSHPDFLGRFVPGYLVDPGLIGQKAVDWTARKIYDRACHAEKWVYWQSPAITVNDLLDPYRTYRRLLRINDVVYVQRPNGNFEKVVIRSVNPAWRGSDRVRWANYEGIFV